MISEQKEEKKLKKPKIKEQLVSYFENRHVTSYRYHLLGTSNRLLCIIIHVVSHRLVPLGYLDRLTPKITCTRLDVLFLNNGNS